MRSGASGVTISRKLRFEGNRVTCLDFLRNCSPEIEGVSMRYAREGLSYFGLELKYYDGWRGNN
jgi:hypothetical protein